jgi:hypothetical protein
MSWTGHDVKGQICVTGAIKTESLEGRQQLTSTDLGDGVLWRVNWFRGYKAWMGLNKLVMTGNSRSTGRNSGSNLE